jgi:hypothetical protein
VPTPRKPKLKVELRPAPVKPPSALSGNDTFIPTTSTSLPPLTTTKPPSSSVSHVRQSPQRSTASDVHNEPFDHLLRRQDSLADFSVHDLEPPPPDLAGIQAFWFTLKQYAVRIFFPCPSFDCFCLARCSWSHRHVSFLFCSLLEILPERCPYDLEASLARCPHPCAHREPARCPSLALGESVFADT